MNKLFKLIALLALTGLTVSCNGYFHGKKASVAIARGVLEKGKATKATCSIMRLPSGKFFSNAIVLDGAYAARIPAGEPFLIDCEVTKYSSDIDGKEVTPAKPVQLLAVSFASGGEMSLNVNVLTTLIAKAIANTKKIKDAASLADAKKAAQEQIETKYGITIGDIDTLSLKSQDVLAQVSLAVQTVMDEGKTFDAAIDGLDKNQVTAQKGKSVNPAAIAIPNKNLVPPEPSAGPQAVRHLKTDVGSTLSKLTSAVTIGKEDVTQSPSDIDLNKDVPFSLPASLVTNLGDNTVYISGKSNVDPIALTVDTDAYISTDVKALFEIGKTTTFTVCILSTTKPNADECAKAEVKQTFKATAIGFYLDNFHVLLSRDTDQKPTLVGNHYTLNYAPKRDFDKIQAVTIDKAHTCDMGLDPYDQDKVDKCAAGGLVQFFITDDIVHDDSANVYLTTKVSNRYGNDPVPRVAGQTGRNRLVRAMWDYDTTTYGKGAVGRLYHREDSSNKFVPPLLTAQVLKASEIRPRFIGYRNWQVKAKTATYTFNVCKHTVSLAQDSQVTGIEALLGTKWNDIKDQRSKLEITPAIPTKIADASDITPKGKNCLSGDSNLGSVKVTVNIVDFEALTSDVKIGEEEAIDPREIDTGKAVPFSLPARLVRKLETGESVYITSDKEGAVPIALKKSGTPQAYKVDNVKILFKDLETPTTFTICIAKTAVQANCLGVDSRLKQTFTAIATGTDNASIRTPSITIKIGEEYEEAIEIYENGPVAFSIPANLVPPLIEDTAIYITSDSSSATLKLLTKEADGSYAIDTIKDLFQARGVETKFTVCVLHDKAVASTATAAAVGRAHISHWNVFEDTSAIPAPSVAACQKAKIKRVFTAIDRGNQDTDNNANAGITVHHGGIGSGASIIRGVLGTVCKTKTDCETPKP